MKLNKKELKLKPGQLYAMWLQTGYHNYHAFGTDPKEMFKHIVKMYNWNANSGYNSATIRKLCKTEEYYVYLFKFNIGDPFGFDDSCQSVGTRGGIELGDYFDIIDYLKGE